MISALSLCPIKKITDPTDPSPLSIVARKSIMKLVRYGPQGHEKPGLIDSDHQLRDLSQHIDDITGKTLLPDALAKLSALNPATLAKVDGKPRLGIPVGQIGKCIAIGLNYTDHAKEVGLPSPPEPIVFMKATSSLCGANDPVQIPRNSEKTDWEVELAAIIGTPARYIDTKAALSHVAGYAICNDVSERAFQIERGGQWTKGKSHDNFGPLGPWLVTRDEIPDPQNLELWLEVDGKRYQHGNTANMIHDLASIIAYLSQFMTLQSGDVITTGTPAGVGMGQKPQKIFLRSGQQMRLGITGLGEQHQHCVAA